MYEINILKFLYLASSLFLLNACGVEHKLTRNLADYTIIFEGKEVTRMYRSYMEHINLNRCRSTFIIDTIWKSSIDPVYAQILKRDYDGNGHLIPINDSTLIDEFVEKNTLNFESRQSNYRNDFNVLKSFNKYNSVFIFEKSGNRNRYLTPTFVLIKSLYNGNYVNYKYIGDVIFIPVKAEQFKKIEKIINRKSKKGDLKN